MKKSGLELGKNESDNPFGNLEQVILGEDAIGVSEDPFTKKEDIPVSSIPKIEKVNIDKILSHLTKIMKPFDNKKADKNIPSRVKISGYIENIYSENVKESTEEGRIRKI